MENITTLGETAEESDKPCICVTYRLRLGGIFEGESSHKAGG
jgi:hypothetical protein